MKYPYLEINIDKIEENARIVTNLCQKNGIAVAGVTKVVCGLPKVARAMLRGGVKQLADSRLENIYRLREDGIRAEIMLLRLPMLSEVEQVVELVDISLNSEMTVIKALSDAAEKAKKVHRIVLMIDLGDLREGILPQETLDFAKNILSLKGVELHGIGTNLACLSGVQPSSENMEILVYIAVELRKRLSIPLPMVTGGNTFSLPLLLSDGIPKGINHLRLGASIIMNASPTPAELHLQQDTIQLHAEVLEFKEKPSSPYGKTAKDAFGKKPVFKDKGIMKRAILGVGREDIDPESLIPVDQYAEILGASSDHLVLNVTDVKREITIGGEMAFNMEYGSVLAAMTSRYVHKHVVYLSESHDIKRNIGIIGAPIVFAKGDKATCPTPKQIRDKGLQTRLTDMGLNITDYKDLAINSSEEKLAEFVSNILKKGEFPLVLGGPHAIIHAELEGISRAFNEFGLICFDAHGDLITSILSDPQDTLPLSLENFVIVGVRDLTRKEKELINTSSITVFTMEDIDKLGMLEVMQRSLDLACDAVDGVHISIDMDFVDRRDAPGVVCDEPGGISYREAHLAMELIAESKRAISADITEIDPAKDPSDTTIKLAISLIASLLGKKLLS